MSDVYERRFIKYFFDDGRPPLESKKYTVDTLGVVRYTIPYSGRESPSIRWKDNYALVHITQNNKQCQLRVARIVASTFLGPPPESTYTVDHADQNRRNDCLYNIRWASKPEQNSNKYHPEVHRSAYIIVNDDLKKEMTAKDWTVVFKKRNGKLYHERTIRRFAQEKLYGFRYKTYTVLEGEIWRPVIGSENKNGRWEVSNMCRMKYITGCTENVFDGERIGLRNGYPTIRINGKNELCHVVVFKTWFPDLYAAMKPNEMILHENDDKADFRPEKLRIGTRAENGKDAHNNGKHYNTKSARQKCASYIDGIFEKEHESQLDAARYLQTHGWPKASIGGVRFALFGRYATMYGRTWKLL